MAAILVTMHCVCDLIIIRNNKETGMGHREMELELTLASLEMPFIKMIIA